MIVVFSWHIHVHAVDARDQSGWSEEESHDVEHTELLVFDFEVREALLVHFDGQLDQIVLMLNSAKQMFTLYSLVFIFSSLI